MRALVRALPSCLGCIIRRQRRRRAIQDEDDLPVRRDRRKTDYSDYGKALYRQGKRRKPQQEAGIAVKEPGPGFVQNPLKAPLLSRISVRRRSAQAINPSPFRREGQSLSTGSRGRNSWACFTRLNLFPPCGNRAALLKHALNADPLIPFGTRGFFPEKSFFYLRPSGKENVLGAALIAARIPQGRAGGRAAPHPLHG